MGYAKRRLLTIIDREREEINLTFIQFVAQATGSGMAWLIIICLIISLPIFPKKIKAEYKSFIFIAIGLVINILLLQIRFNDISQQHNLEYSINNIIYIYHTAFVFCFSLPAMIIRFLVLKKSINLFFSCICAIVVVIFSIKILGEIGGATLFAMWTYILNVRDEGLSILKQSLFSQGKEK
jgi:hypothetical protein